jgi:hypothetical protein
LKISLYKAFQNDIYEVVSEVLFKKPLSWFKLPASVELVIYTAASY